MTITAGIRRSAESGPPATEAEVDNAIANLAPALCERADETQRLHRLPDSTFSDFISSGLMRSAQPSEFGGTELSLQTQVGVVEKLASSCASAAWTLGVYISHNWNLALFPLEAQRDVWGSSPDAVACTSAAGGPPPKPTSEGVLIEEGAGVFSPVCITLTGSLLTPPCPPGDYMGQPELTSLLIPRGEYQIVEDWDTIALAGTGTCSVVITDTFVPRHRMLRFADQQAGTSPGGQHHINPMYRAPLDAIWPAYLAAPAVGAARGAIDAWKAAVKVRRHAYTTEPANANPYHHTRLGEADAALDAARLMLHRAVNAVADGVERDADMTNVRVRNRRDYAYIARLCALTSESMLLAAGASALSSRGELQRHWRDAHGVSQHAMFEYERSLAAWGRRELGISDGLDF